jgi:S1-C subfamily serine protease
MIRAPLTLAGEAMADVIITMIESPEWSVFPSGVIGLPILRRFDIATAAKEKALFLKRNALKGLPERYNRAGMWIDSDGSNAKIGVVGPGSPADIAGLKAGDRLIGVDVKELINRMFQPAGNNIALTVERAGAHRELNLRLEDFL